jgi:hypothetical protein
MSYSHTGKHPAHDGGPNQCFDFHDCEVPAIVNLTSKYARLNVRLEGRPAASASIRTERTMRGYCVVDALMRYGEAVRAVEESESANLRELAPVNSQARDPVLCV